MASIYLRGRIWWTCFCQDGHKYDTSLKTKDKRVAQYRKSQIEQKILLGIAVAKNKEIVQDKLLKAQWVFTRWPKMTDREKQAVFFTMFGGMCFHCGKEVTLPQNIDRSKAKKSRMVLDHIVPFSCGGGDTPDNLVAACHECNSKRSDGAIPQAKVPVMPVPL